MKKHKQKPDQLYNYLKDELEEGFSDIFSSDTEYEQKYNLRLELWDDFAGSMFDACYGSLRYNDEEA